MFFFFPATIASVFVNAHHTFIYGVPVTWPKQSLDETEPKIQQWHLFTTLGMWNVASSQSCTRK